MPGDLNRVLLNGIVTSPPIEAGKTVRFGLTTTERWTTTIGPKTHKIDHNIVVVFPRLASYALKLRMGDLVHVEGMLDIPNVVLGSFHSALQLLRPSSDDQRSRSSDDQRSRPTGGEADVDSA